jgi:hypothetical protein
MLIHLPGGGPTNIPLLVSMAGWVLFSGYWSIASKSSSPVRSSESRASRRVHELLVNAALLLILLPVRGLTQRYLPDALFVVWAGLSIQAASGLLGVWARGISVLIGAERSRSKLITG